ncbi:MAG: ABC transporter permease [Candidatus Woesearchaeota archaeon]
MIKNYVTLAFKNLSHRKLRSWLTLIGIFIGIAAVVSLISLGEGLQNAVTEQFKSLGSDRVIILPGGMLGPPGSETSLVTLTKEDVKAVKKTKGVKDAAGVLIETLRIERDKDVVYSMVFGIPTGEDSDVFEVTKRFEVERGRKIKAGDKFKAVVGLQYAKEQGILEKPLDIGDTIKINGFDFEIIGIRKTQGNSISDSQVIISEEALRDITKNYFEVSVIHAIIEQGVNPDVVVDNVKKELRKSRNVEKGKEDFDVTTSAKLIKSVTSILIIIEGIIIGIAAISLLVGGIGIMNTMYTSVLERTREIGIMKAVGAKNSDIMLIFLLEAGFLGAVGGVLGVVLGFVVSKSVEYIGAIVWGSPLLRADFSLSLVLGAVSFAFFIGTISGTLPAIQAAKLKPVDALRYE